jgi:hypothetical protein
VKGVSQPLRLGGGLGFVAIFLALGRLGARAGTAGAAVLATGATAGSAGFTTVEASATGSGSGARAPAATGKLGLGSATALGRPATSHVPAASALSASNESASHGQAARRRVTPDLVSVTGSSTAVSACSARSRSDSARGMTELGEPSASFSAENPVLVESADS